MLISLLGTCRLQCIREHFTCTKFDDEISFVHSTKEIIQLIHFITNKIIIPDDISRYCFRTGILLKKPIPFSEQFLKDFDKTDLFIIELSSSRKYMYNDYYLHHLAVDARLGNYKNTPRNIRRSTCIVHQTNDEIKQDIVTIKELLGNKRILLVSHINARVRKPAAGNYFSRIFSGFPARKIFQSGRQRVADEMIELPRRVALINLVSATADELGIDFINPSVVLQDYPQEQILCPEEPGAPPGHYTELGHRVVGELLVKKINFLMGKEISTGTFSE